MNLQLWRSERHVLLVSLVRFGVVERRRVVWGNMQTEQSYEKSEFGIIMNGNIYLLLSDPKQNVVIRKWNTICRRASVFKSRIK